MNNSLKLNQQQYICAICNNAQDNHIYTTHEQMLSDHEMFHVMECSHCGALQLLDIPKNMSKFYADQYYSMDDVLKDGMLIRIVKKYLVLSALHNGIFYRFASFLAGVSKLDFLSHIPLSKNDKILDIGSGQGSIPYYLTEANFKQCTGIDPYINTKKIIYKNGAVICKKNLDDPTLKDKYYDYIMLHHAFEHMSNPKKILALIHQKLVPGGTCIIRIPIADSYAWKTYHGYWFQLDAPRHIFIHTQKSISILSKQTGFKIKKIIFDSVGLPLILSQLNLDGMTFRDFKTHNKGFYAIFHFFNVMRMNIFAKKLNKKKIGDQAIFILMKK